MEKCAYILYYSLVIEVMHIAKCIIQEQEHTKLM